MGSHCISSHHRTCKTFFVNSKKWCQKLGKVVFRGLCTSWFRSHSCHHMDGSRTLRGSDSERQGHRTAVCGETRTTNNKKTMIYCKDSVTPAGPLALCHARIHYSNILLAFTFVISFFFVHCITIFMCFCSMNILINNK